MECAPGKRSAVTSIAGFGYVGLPLTSALAETGSRCLGIELDEGRRDALEAGRSYVLGVPVPAIGRLVAVGRLSASTEYAPLSQAHPAIVRIPTSVCRDRRFDARRLPRVTRESVARVLAGTDPPGNLAFSRSAIASAVGGIEAASFRLATALYCSTVPELVTMSSAREGEVSKPIGNTFRPVNTAPANESAEAAERLRIDFCEAVRAASRKPFRFMPFYPNPGVRGRCLPAGLHHLVWDARGREMPCPLVDTAEHVKAAMPLRVVDRVAMETNVRGPSAGGTRVRVLGVSCKRSLDDIRESPARRTMELLKAKATQVSYHDPYVPKLRWRGGVLASVPLSRDVLPTQTCVASASDQGYDVELLARHSPLRVDARNGLNGQYAPPTQDTMTQETPS